MPELKPIIVNLDKLPEPFRNYCKQNVTNLISRETIVASLTGGFVWRESPQGDSFWRNLKSIMKRMDE